MPMCHIGNEICITYNKGSPERKMSIYQITSEKTDTFYGQGDPVTVVIWLPYEQYIMFNVKTFTPRCLVEQ